MGEESRMNRHIGSNFDDFLAEDGRLEEAATVAIKRVTAWQLGDEMMGASIDGNAAASNSAQAGSIPAPPRHLYRSRNRHIG